MGLEIYFNIVKMLALGLRIANRWWERRKKRVKKHAFEKKRKSMYVDKKMQGLGDVVGTILFHQRIKIWAFYVHGDSKNRDKDLEVIPYVSYLLLHKKTAHNFML